MNKFKSVAALLAILMIGSQTLRHAYVLWVERTESVLDKFEPTQQKIAATQTIDELLNLYEPAQQQVKVADEIRKANKGEERSYREYDEEPYKSERELKQAIEEREERAKQLTRLHFFWWSGLVALVLGVIATVRHRPWLGVCAFVLGFLEMIWFTCPSYRTLGFPIEVKQLLTFKLIYSASSLALLLAGWKLVETRAKDEGTKAAPSCGANS